MRPTIRSMAASKALIFTVTIATTVTCRSTAFVETFRFLLSCAIASAMPVMARLRRSRRLCRQFVNVLARKFASLCAPTAALHVKRSWPGAKKTMSSTVWVWHGERELHAANEVIRLSSRRDLISEVDWKFITNHAFAVDDEWIEWLTQSAPKKSCPPEKGRSDLALTLLQALALHEPSAVDRIVSKASENIFRGDHIPVAKCVRITQIMAALGSQIPTGFKYVSQDLHLRDVSAGVVADDIGQVGDLVPESWAQRHILYPEYTKEFTSCKRDRWEEWVKSQASRLSLCPPIREKPSRLYSRSSVQALLEKREAETPKEYHYKRDEFSLEDFGFDQELIMHWQQAAAENKDIWASVLATILTAPAHNWNKKTEAQIRHNGNLYHKHLDCGSIPAEWIVHFRSVPCLFDTSGNIRTPAEL